MQEQKKKILFQVAIKRHGILNGSTTLIYNNYSTADIYDQIMMNIYIKKVWSPIDASLTWKSSRLNLNGSSLQLVSSENKVARWKTFILALDHCSFQMLTPVVRARYHFCSIIPRGVVDLSDMFGFQDRNPATCLTHSIHEVCLDKGNYLFWSLWTVVSRYLLFQMFWEEKLLKINAPQLYAR